MGDLSSDRGPVYRIESERLVIRCWKPSDAPLLKAAVDKSREHLKPWMPWAHGDPEKIQRYTARLREFRGKFDLDQDYIYGIFNRDEQLVLGGTGLHTRVGEGAREIGYWIHKDHIGQGLATETVSALVKAAFEGEGVDRIEIHCNPNNVRSAAVPRKLGFTLEAVLKKRQRQKDQWIDTMVWSLFADEYGQSPAAKIEIKAYDAAGKEIL